MGLVSSARCCQMLTDAITFIFFQDGFQAVNYIDDFGGAETADKAWNAFFQLVKIIAEIGMKEAEEKATPRSHIMVFLGLEVNTLDMTIKISGEKWCEIKTVLKKWMTMKVATKKQVQQLVGLLNFAAGCVKPGRIYFSRILNFLRSIKRSKARIPEEVKLDVQWCTVVRN